MPERNGSDRAWADAVAGVIGGVAGILAMEAYWKGVGALLGRDPRAEMQESRREPVAYRPAVVDRKRATGGTRRSLRSYRGIRRRAPARLAGRR